MAFEGYIGSETDQLNPSNKVHSTSPYWVLIVIPFDKRFSLDMERVASHRSDVGLRSLDNHQMDTKPIIMLDNHCIQWSVEGSKSNFTHTASFTLVPPEVIDLQGNSGVPNLAGTRVITLSRGESGQEETHSYEPHTKLSKGYNIAPSDWVMFWAMDNKEDYQEVKGKITQGRSANMAHLGLKFVGRVSSFRSTFSISESGAKINRYHMDCHGFREFDNTIYYNDLIYSTQTTNVSKIINDLAGSINGFIVGDSSTSLVQTQYAVPRLFTLLFDVNFIGRVLAGTSMSPESKRVFSGLGVSPNRPYYVPKMVGTLLGLKTKDVYTYCDIVSQYVGIQQYWKKGKRNPVVTRKIGAYDYSSEFSGLGTDYWPDNLKYTDDTDKVKNLYEYPQMINTQMFKQTIHFDGRSAWSILTTYLNDPVNELYTSMIVNPDGRIMPSLVCRQLPFTSKTYAEPQRFNLTRFVEVPRWVIDDSWIMHYDIGMSDSLDINFVKLEAMTTAADQTAARAELNAYAPPFVDSIDVSRNGVRMYNRNLSADISPAAGGPWQAEAWTSIMTDIMMRLKYTSSGSLSCRGIQAPIPIGDNLVLRDTLFHIEGLSHHGTIDSMGHKVWTTHFTLSHGVKLNQQRNDDMGANFIPQQLKNPEIDPNTSGNLSDEELGAIRQQERDVEKAIEANKDQSPVVKKSTAKEKAKARKGKK